MQVTEDGIEFEAQSDEDVLRIYTDGSSLGNGKKTAIAGVGVFFGDGDKRYDLQETFWIPN